MRHIRVGTFYSGAGKKFQLNAVRLLELLTMVLECFHLVSLFRTLSRLIQENRFLQQNWLLSPAS